MQLQRPTEPSLEHLHPLRQQLLAGGARISRVTHFNGESAPEETSAPTSMSRPNKHAEKLPLGPHPRAVKAQGKAVKAKRRRTLLGSLVCSTLRVLARTVKTAHSCTGMPVRPFRPRVTEIKAVSQGHRRRSAGAARREARVRTRKRRAVYRPQPPSRVSPLLAPISALR